MSGDLIKIYKTRKISKEEPILDLEYLENLFATNNKRLQFIIFYWYLTKQKIPYELSKSSILSMMVFTITKSIKDYSVIDYYSTYFDIEEIEIQWNKIYKEIEIISNRNLIMDSISKN